MKARNIIAFGLLGLGLVGGGATAAVAGASPAKLNQGNQASASASTPSPVTVPTSTVPTSTVPTSTVPPAPSPSAPVNGNATVDPLMGSTATHGYLVGLAVAVDMEVLSSNAIHTARSCDSAGYGGRAALFLSVFSDTAL